MIIKNETKLPEKIYSSFQKKKKLNGSFILSFKTLFKPDATIPILWFTLLDDGILFLNSHKTRGIFKEIDKSEVNSIKFNKVSSTIFVEIVFNDIYENNFLIEIPSQIDVNILKEHLSDCGYSVN